MTLESSPTVGRPELGGKSYYQITGGKYDFAKYVRTVGGKILKGYQLRYIHLIDTTCNLNCPNIPFSKIDEMGAGMYRGDKITMAERQTQAQQAKESKQPATSGKEGGSSPTVALNLTQNGIKTE